MICLNYEESSLLIRRLGQHLDGLIDESHDYTALAAAFKQQNKKIENFRFRVLKSGPEWEDVEVRKQYEEMLTEANKHRCYNVKGLSNSTEEKNKRLPLMYNGTPYPSARAAAAGEKIDRSTVRRHLKSIKHPNVYYLPKEKYGQIPIFAQQGKGFSVLFESMGECVSANYATNAQNARRKIKRKEEGWRYAHLDLNNKPLRIPYMPQPGEMTYQQYSEICSFFFLLNFVNQKLEI